MPDLLTLASQQSRRIGKLCAEVEPEVDPVGVRRREYECIARPVCEREMVRDRVHLVNKFVRFRRLFKDQLSRRERELDNRLAMPRQQHEIPRIGRIHAHFASVSHHP